MALGDRTYASARSAVPEAGPASLSSEAAFAGRVGATAAVLKGELIGGLAAEAGGLGPLGGRASGGAIRRESGKDTKLPMSFLIAVTQAHVYVYKYVNLWAASGSRASSESSTATGLVVEVGDGTMRRFTLHSPAAGQTMAFEMMRTTGHGRARERPPVEGLATCRVWSWARTGARARRSTRTSRRSACSRRFASGASSMTSRDRLGERVAVSVGDGRVFLYAGTREAVREAVRVASDVLAEHEIEADFHRLALASGRGGVGAGGYSAAPLRQRARR